MACALRIDSSALILSRCSGSDSPASVESESDCAIAPGTKKNTAVRAATLRFKIFDLVIIDIIITLEGGVRSRCRRLEKLPDFPHSSVQNARGTLRDRDDGHVVAIGELDHFSLLHHERFVGLDGENAARLRGDHRLKRAHAG